MITLYRPNSSLGPATELQAALVAGFKVIGVDHEERDCLDYRPTDVAVVHGWRKSRTVGTPFHRTPIIDSQFKAGKQILCCERGLWDRQRCHVLAWDGMCGSGEWGHLRGMKPSRWEGWGLEMKPWRAEGEHVLVCGQVLWDANVEETDHVAWLVRVLQEIRACVTRPIVFRPHPKIATRGGRGYYDAVLQTQVDRVSVSDPLSRPIGADLEGAHCSVSWNSNSGIDSILAGVPTFAFHRNTMAWDVACHDLDLIGDPPLPDREQWAWDLAYRQWRTAEIASGEAWEWVGRGMRLPGIRSDAS